MRRLIKAKKEYGLLLATTSALTLGSLLAFSHPAYAVCAPDPVANGGSVVCIGVDAGGFQSTSTDVTLTVDASATVQGSTLFADRFKSPLSLGENATVIINGTVESQIVGTTIFTSTGANVTNNGTISNVLIPSSDFRRGAQINGSFINRGLVEVVGQEFVTGIRVQEATGLTGTLVNEGIITMQAFRSSSAVIASKSTATNAAGGEIRVTGVLSIGNPALLGIRVHAMEAALAGSTVTNSGTIIMTGTVQNELVGLIATTSDVAIPMINSASGSITINGTGAGIRAGNSGAINAGTIELNDLSGGTRRSFGIRAGSAAKLTNSGSIRITGDKAVGITFIARGELQTLDNSGTIETSGAGAAFTSTAIPGSPGISIESSDVVITNTGVIRATGATSAGVGIGAFSGSTQIDGGTPVPFDNNTINSSGVIEGVTAGVLLNGFTNALIPTITINNLVGGTITGTGSDGIRSIDGSLVITNRGTITGADKGIFATGGGIAIIDTFGTITGTGGTAIQLGDGVDQLIVRGSATINGAINLGGGADVLNLQTGSTLNGAINLGDGDDELVIFPTTNITGGVDMGSGTDTLAFDGAAGTTGNVSFLVGTVPFAVGVERTEKRGEGTFIFEGGAVPASVDLAPAFVLNGTAVVNASVPSLDVTNEASGRLEGTGEVRNIINNGTFAPGNSIGTMTVVGNLTLAAGGTFEIEIDSANNSDLVNVTGITTVAGTLNVSAGGALSAFSTTNSYTIINSTGGVTGAFGTITDNLPDLDVVASINANDVTLGLVAAGTAPPTTPPTTPGIDFSDKSVLPNSVQAAGHSGRMFAGTLQRQAQSSSLQGSNAPIIQPAAAGGPINLQYFSWMAALGSKAKFDNSAGTTGYDAKTGGFALGSGVQFRSANDAIVRAGLGFGYTRTDISNSPSSADIDTWHFGAYGSFQSGQLTLAAAVGVGFQDHETTRVIPLVGAGAVVAKGDTKGHVFDVSASAAYDIAPHLGISQNNSLRFAPLIRFDHVSVKRNGFMETGAGILNQAVSSDTYNRTWLGVGFQVSKTYQTRAGAEWRPELELRYDHALGNKRAVTNSSIPTVAGANFVTAGIAENRDTFAVGAGVSVSFTETITGTLRYDGAFSNDTSIHHGSAKINFMF